MSKQLQTQSKTPTPAPSFTPVRTGLLQRRCACGGSPGMAGECAECRNKKPTLQRRSTNQTEPAAVPPIVHDVLRSPGQPLDLATRAFMEPRFGHDFSHVRVHTDARAAESARAVHALAYTVGPHVVLDRSENPSATGEGQRMLAHELPMWFSKATARCSQDSSLVMRTTTQNKKPTRLLKKLLAGTA